MQGNKQLIRASLRGERETWDQTAFWTAGNRIMICKVIITDIFFKLKFNPESETETETETVAVKRRSRISRLLRQVKELCKLVTFKTETFFFFIKLFSSN
ncbi:hypothetical protein MIMGU_mgv1a016966mg [Erythranthe guttata]|uniref:Uncharacterized protein n=1 Tax=Erythranthe guttata TaxID=4155 RepID=A0A022QZR9_ERYGU|nr:hypothetical protein MIMGU_mgv1a016966mg [Erythranthe guttata]